MRNLWLSLITALLFFATSAVAQTSSSNQQGTQGTTSASPATSGAQGQSPQGSNSPSDMNSGQTGQNPGYSSGANQGTQGTTKGERKLKGCVQSQNGQYALQTKSGKVIPLTGQDVSAHTGHEVALHGTWAGSDMSGMSGGSGNMSNGSAHSFNVTSVDMISDSCTGGKQKGSSSGSSMQQQ